MRPANSPRSTTRRIRWDCRFRSRSGGGLDSLLWGRHRGLTFYAPILLLDRAGLDCACARRCFSRGCGDDFSSSRSVLMVNIFYPEWTGGWSTGPRLLVPLLPFAVLPIAGLLAGDAVLSGGPRPGCALALSLAGATEMLSFQGVGGRVPHDIADPDV